jgi:hypothetical protein
MFATVGSTNTTLEELAELRREIARLESVFLTGLADYDRSYQYHADGFINAAVALRLTCKMSAGEARSHLELARKLQSLPLTAEALAEGTISRHHAAIIAKAYTRDRAPALAALEDTFVTGAKRMQPRQLKAAVQYACDAIDAHERSLRRLHLSPSLDGAGVLDGRLDPESTEIVRTALDAEMERDRITDDPRTPSQRRHDALVAICRRTLDAGELGTTRNVRPHISVVAHIQEYGSIDAMTAYGLRVSEAMLERLLCDCDLTRVLMRGNSEVLDVGRSSRTPTAAQWKALVARDGHCQAPGCDRPPAHCQAHHIVYWENDGPTDLANLQLLCWDHHHEIHRNDRRRRKRAP